MKTKSTAGKDVYFELWSTPLDRATWLWLSSVLQTMDSIHFFFRINSDIAKRIYVMSIPRLSPYRLIEERYAVGCVDKNLVATKAEKNRPVLNPKGQSIRTWKLWGTQFIKEIDENTSLSSYKKKPDKNIVQYLIRTEDEYIEFIPSREPRWKSYSSSTIEKLLVHYSKEEQKW